MDIYFDQKDFDIVLEDDGTGLLDVALVKSPTDTLIQRLFIRFKTYKRDLIWNTQYGIDYINDVFGMKKSKFSVDIIIKDEIKKEPLVDEILYFESEVIDYKYACKFIVSLKEEQQKVTYYILTTEDGLTITNENGDVLTFRL